MSGHVCPWWFGYVLVNPLRRFFTNPEKILSPYVKMGMRILEIGPGMGFFTLAMAKMLNGEKDFKAMLELLNNLSFEVEGTPVVFSTRSVLLKKRK